MDNFILSTDELFNYRINLESKYSNNYEKTDINDELEYIFSSDDNIYEIKAILRKNKLAKELIDTIDKNLLIKWFKDEYDVSVFQQCQFDNYCKLKMLNEYFISIFSSNHLNKFDMNFAKKEADYIVNGEIDINKISGAGDTGAKFSLYKKKNMLKGVERGLYRRNNAQINHDNDIERENMIYKRYS